MGDVTAESEADGIDYICGVKRVRICKQSTTSFLYCMIEHVIQHLTKVHSPLDPNAISRCGAGIVRGPELNVWGFGLPEFPSGMISTPHVQ